MNDQSTWQVLVRPEQREEINTQDRQWKSRQ